LARSGKSLIDNIKLSLANELLFNVKIISTKFQLTSTQLVVFVIG